MTPQEIGTAELRRRADETAWSDFWLTNVAQERGERSSQWKQDGVKASSEYEAKEQATRYSLPSYAPSGWRAKQ